MLCFLLALGGLPGKPLASSGRRRVGDSSCLLPHHNPSPPQGKGSQRSPCLWILQRRFCLFFLVWIRTVPPAALPGGSQQDFSREETVSLIPHKFTQGQCVDPVGRAECKLLPCPFRLPAHPRGAAGALTEPPSREQARDNY
jgi:hypothetical protein